MAGAGNVRAFPPRPALSSGFTHRRLVSKKGVSVNQSPEDEHLKRIRAAAAERILRLSELDQVKANLREQIRQALALGLTASELAAASGLPLQEIQDLARTGP
jgi:hypothetical protein